MVSDGDGGGSGVVVVVIVVRGDHFQYLFIVTMAITRHSRLSPIPLLLVVAMVASTMAGWQQANYNNLCYQTSHPINPYAYFNTKTTYGAVAGNDLLAPLGVYIIIIIYWPLLIYFVNTQPHSSLKNLLNIFRSSLQLHYYMYIIYIFNIRVHMYMYYEYNIIIYIPASRPHVTRFSPLDEFVYSSFH